MVANTVSVSSLLAEALFNLSRVACDLAASNQITPNPMLARHLPYWGDGIELFRDYVNQHLKKGGVKIAYGFSLATSENGKVTLVGDATDKRFLGFKEAVFARLPELE